MESAQVTIDEISGVPVVKVTGEIDISTVPLFTAKLDEIEYGVSDVIIDFSELNFIDSSGLNALVACQKRLADGVQNCTVHLVVTKPSVLRVLEVTGLREVFPTASTVQEAITSS
jgi:anti-sigma B factor antagonist